MKKLSIHINILLAFIVLITTGAAFGQEYDDIYFRKKDRIKVAQVSSTPDAELDVSNSQPLAFDKSTNPEYLASSDTVGQSDEEVYFEEGYEQQALQQAVSAYNEDADVVVKHYYYGNPNSRYYQRFDDVFWSDPFLYQGTIFDPFFDPYYRSTPFYRPGWNVRISVGGGYPYYGGRWRSNSFYRYNNYFGFGWGGYYDPWYGYYDPFWCPPSYYSYGQNYVVINNEGYYNSSRGVVRGKRSTRNSRYTTNNVNAGSRTGRVASNSANGRVANENTTGLKTRGGNGRVSSASTRTGDNYSGFRRSTTNSSGYSSRTGNNNTSAGTVNRNNRSSDPEGTTSYRRGRDASTSTYSSRNRSNNSGSSNSYSGSRSRSSNSYQSSSGSRSSSSRSSVNRSSSSRSSGSSRSSVSRSSGSRSSGSTRSSSSSRRKKD